MATEEEKEKFFDLVKKGNIGLSANYLNFNDLADCKYLKEKIHTNTGNLRRKRNPDQNSHDCRY